MTKPKSLYDGWTDCAQNVPGLRDGEDLPLLRHPLGHPYVAVPLEDYKVARVTYRTASGVASGFMNWLVPKDKPKQPEIKR